MSVEDFEEDGEVRRRVQRAAEAELDPIAHPLRAHLQAIDHEPTQPGHVREC